METELKFTLSTEAQHRLERYLGRGGHDGSRQVEMLRTTYFDSPDRRLAKAGFSLRVRQLINGAQSYRQAVKSDGEATFERQEWEWSLDGPQPDIGRLAEVPAFPFQVVSASDIGPIFRTEVKRTTLAIRPAPGTKVELALDEGLVIAPTGSEPLRELELAQLAQLERRLGFLTDAV
jgi:inorganic triphosphatase YgiF